MSDIESIKAQLEICRIKARQMRMVDSKDWAGYAATLTADFVLDLTQGVPMPIINGRDAAVDALQQALATAVTIHHAHAPEFEVKGDEVNVSWAIQDRLILGPDQPSYLNFAQHHDRWVRQAGQWKLAVHRRVLVHTDTYPPAAAPPKAAG